MTLNLVLSDIQCSAIRFRNTLLDLSEKPSKPIMNFLVGVSEYQLIEDDSLLYILCFTLAQVTYFNKTNIIEIHDTIDSLYDQTVSYHAK